MEMYGLMYSLYFNSAVDRVLKKKVHELEGAQLIVTEMHAAVQKQEEITGMTPISCGTLVKQLQSLRRSPV